MRILHVGLLVVAGAVLGLVAAPASSETMAVVLSDANSVAVFDPASPWMQYAWDVDQRNYLCMQGFWYRFDGAGGGELPLASLGPVAATAWDTNDDGQDDFLRLTYTGNSMTVGIVLTLSGGSWGSGRSGIGETIRITNTSPAPLGVHFFQYVDLDLSFPPDDRLLIQGGNTARQTAGASVVSETADTPSPNHYEAGYYSDIISALMDDQPTTLSDWPGEYRGDAAWAFQWDRTIDPGSTFLISKVKSLHVPEPATLILMGVGAAGMLLRRRRRSLAG